MDKTLLITRPEYEAPTLYLSKWSEDIIKEAETKGFKVIDLRRDKANKKRVVGTLEKTNAKFVVFNGHGNDAVIYGQDNEAILEMSDTKAVKNKIIYARACRAASILGNNAIASGAISFLGYTEDFIFFRNINNERKPLEDKTAKQFLEPSNYLPISLLKGHTTGEANNRSKNLFRKNIEKLIVAGPTSSDYQTIRGLLWNMQHQVCLGDKSATL
jgi:hypothetical protein